MLLRLGQVRIEFVARRPVGLCAGTTIARWGQVSWPRRESGVGSTRSLSEHRVRIYRPSTGCSGIPTDIPGRTGQAANPNPPARHDLVASQASLQAEVEIPTKWLASGRRACRWTAGPRRAVWAPTIPCR